MSTFTDTMTRWLEGIASAKDQWTLRRLLEPLFDAMSSTTLNTSGLQIKAGGSALAKSGAADCYYVANGVMNKISATTDMPSLTGINMTAAYFNVVCFFGDSGGTLTAAGGTQGATLGAVVFPQFPKNKALIGILIITYASAFVGGTTPLDTATTVYVSPAGSDFNPNLLTG